MGIAVTAFESLRSDIRVRLIHEREPTAVAAFAQSMGTFRRVVPVQLSHGYSLDPERYDRILNALREDISIFWRNRISLIRMGRLWVKNLFANIGAMNWADVRPVPAVQAGPVVVCGAGPSLDLALPLLRELDDGVHIMACDTAAGALVLSGVRVDSVVCLEGQVYNLEDFLPLNTKPVDAFVDLSAHPSSYRALMGPKILLSSRWADLRLLDRLAAAGFPMMPVPPLGSVGVLSLRIAAAFHGGPLFITGLDFAYPAGRTHCAGSPIDLTERRLETRLYKKGDRWASTFRDGTSCNDKGLVCDPALSMYADLASQELSLFSQAPGGLAYDLRQGIGARLPARPTEFGEARTVLRLASRARAKASPEGIEPEAWASAARRFLERELELARKLRTALRTVTGVPALTGLVADCDYMFAHFPDPQRVAALELDGLKRLAAEAEYWEGRLKDALAGA